MKQNVKDIIFGLIVLFFVAIFNSICFMGARDADKVHESRGKSVELTAVITSSDKYTETDEGFERDYWHANVSYDYDGEHYSGVFYKSYSNEPTLGKEVNVKINPDNPNEILPTSGELAIWFVVAPVFLAIITYVVYEIAKSFVEMLMKKEGENNPTARNIAIVFSALKLICESLVFYATNDSFAFGVIAIVAVIILAVFLMIMKKRRKAKTDAQV